MTRCSACSRSMTGASRGSAPPQLREQRLVLEGVVHGDDPAVGLAVRAEGPVVLPHRHLVEVRPRGAGVDRARRDLVDQVADLVEFGAQVVVDLDQLRAVGLLLGGVGPGRVTGRAGGPVASSQTGSALRRVPSSGVGHDAKPADAGDGLALRCVSGSGSASDVPRAARSAATSSRTAGATSAANRRRSSGSSAATMNALIPSVRASSASCSAHCSPGRASSRWLPARTAAELSSRRISSGDRPACSAASSMILLRAASSPGGR